MMTRCLTGLAAFAMSAGLVQAGGLQELYRTKGLHLVPDASYAASTDWQKVFSDYFDTFSGAPLGTRRQLAVAPDGSVFVSNYAQYTVYKFDPSGKLTRTFGGKGTGRGQFQHNPSLCRLIDGRYLPVGHSVFDLDGNFVQTVTLDYPTYRSVGLSKKRLAVYGLILYGGKRPPKDLIAIKDLDTGKEVEVRSATWPVAGEMAVRVAGARGMFSFGPPFARVEPIIAATSKGDLVAGFSNSPEITIHSPEGRLISRFDVQIQPIAVTDKHKQEYYDSAAQTFAKLGLPRVALDALREPWFFPAHLPYYYNLIVDSEDNILVFPYTDDGPAHRFQVYGLDGRLVCESAINPGDFELNLNPRSTTLAFAGAYLYGILPLKTAPGVPLRLFRVDLAAQEK
jgi:hypothetical protein